MQKSYFGIHLSLLVHFAVLNTTFYFLIPDTYRVSAQAVAYYNLTWLIVIHSTNFYKRAKQEPLTIKSFNYLRLFVLYGLAFFASFSIIRSNVYKPQYLFWVYGILCLQLIFFRLFFYWASKLYRSRGVDKKKVVVVGLDRNLKKVRTIFDNPRYDYTYVGFFDNKTSKSPTYLGSIDSCYKYIFKNDISEVFCLASRLSKEEIRNLMQIADSSFKRIKIIPDNKELFSRAMTIELYGGVPVINLRASPLELEYANVVKRMFDIVFSSVVIITVLSWVIPLVWILMRIDSKGPLFFKQSRHGVNRTSFYCYKFRSMTKTERCDSVMATKNDMRVTRLGRILRKTSIDELPQFFNVLKGDMSVVGPRPHMEVHTEEYEKSVDKYLVRHFLKPGITGLAQVKGYRGEIVKKSDIINRVRYDIFYMEKWSLCLDIVIIYHTISKAYKGAKKAY